jgi:PAS domain S-box-containing protein
MKFKQLEPYYRLFEHAPVATAFLDANDLKLEMANQSMLDLWHRPLSVKGAALLDFMPELAEQQYPALLKRVISTGEVHRDTGARVILERAGKTETVFMDYSYTPIFSNDDKTMGVLVMATDVCERELNRLIVSQSYRDLRSIVISSPVPMCIYRGPLFQVETVNNPMLNIWQGSCTINPDILKHVYHNGRPYQELSNGIKYSYTPMGDHNYGVVGVCVVAALEN